MPEKDILGSISSLSNEFGILKYHFYLARSEDAQIKNVLYYPIDSIALKSLLGKKSSLALIDEKMYHALQDVIQKYREPRIDYGTVWDEQHLQEERIL